jgi:hypothetical protein
MRRQQQQRQLNIWSCWQRLVRLLVLHRQMKRGQQQQQQRQQQLSSCQLLQRSL